MYLRRDKHAPHKTTDTLQHCAYAAHLREAVAAAAAQRPLQKNIRQVLKHFMGFLLYCSLLHIDMLNLFVCLSGSRLGATSVKSEPRRAPRVHTEEELVETSTHHELPSQKRPL